MAAMRISVSNWTTTEADADLGVAAIRRLAEAIPARLNGSLGAAPRAVL